MLHNKGYKLQFSIVNTSLSSVFNAPGHSNSNNIPSLIRMTQLTLMINLDNFPYLL